MYGQRTSAFARPEVMDGNFWLVIETGSTGHSLAASRVVARVGQLFRLDLPVKALFESPTVADMARVILENQSQRANQTNLERLLGDIETLSRKKHSGVWRKLIENHQK